MIFIFIICLFSEIIFLSVGLGFLKFVLSEHYLNCKDELIMSIVCITMAICNAIAAFISMN